MIYKCQFR